MALREWQEDEHPRDDIGRFTFKNGGGVTSKDEKIQEKIRKENAEHTKMQKIADVLYPTMMDKGGFVQNNPNIKLYSNTRLGGGVLIDNLPLTNYLNNKIKNDAYKILEKVVDNRVFSDNALRKARIFIQNAEHPANIAYQDEKGVWTIGYGHTKYVKPGDTITDEQAEKLYAEDFKIHADALRYVKIPLSDNEKVALASLIYNIGETQFRNSTVLKRLNEGDKTGAAEAFKLFCKETTIKTVNGKRVRHVNFSKGLYNRRIREMKLFLTPD